MSGQGDSIIRSHNHRRLALAAWLMHEAPIVLLAILLGVALSWRAIAAAAAAWLAFVLHLKADRKWPPDLKPAWYRTTIDVTVSSISLSIVGGLLFGGIGAIFGLVGGVVFAISSIPLSVKNPKAGLTKVGGVEPDRLGLTLQNSPGTAKALTIAGFASPAVLLLACVLLLLSHR
jgi:hypothetical protein